MIMNTNKLSRVNTTYSTIPIMVEKEAVTESIKLTSLLYFITIIMSKKKKPNPDWMKYWDNVNVELYALIKQLRKSKKE